MLAGGWRIPADDTQIRLWYTPSVETSAARLVITAGKGGVLKCDIVPIAAHPYGMTPHFACNAAPRYRLAAFLRMGPNNERRKPRKKRKSLNRYPASRTWRLPICRMRAMMDTMTIRLRWMRVLLRKSWIKGLSSRSFSSALRLPLSWRWQSC